MMNNPVEKSDESMDADNNKADEDRLSSDSATSDEEDEQQIEMIKTLQAEVKKNLYNYDSHIQLITALRTSGDLLELRNARDKMNEIFPLSPDLWLDWLRDEAKLVSSPESRVFVRDLFERAVKDYTSVDLWLEYCQFMIGDLAESDGVKSIRKVFEQAITSVGLHVTSGNLIYEAYREFENAVLSMMQPSAGSVVDDSTKKKIEDQMKVLTSIFRRQISVPHLNIDQTYEEYKEFDSSGVSEIDISKYKNAKKILQDRVEFENKLESSEKPHYQEYLEYLDFEKKKGDPARIQMLFERAITDNCLIPDLWLQYCEYIDKKLKIGSISLPVHERSVRNCPWSYLLWIEYIKAAEKFRMCNEDVKKLLDRALLAGFTSGEEYHQVWMIYLEYLARRVDWSIKVDNTELDVLHESFNNASNYMSEYFPNDGDSYCSILKFWARLEARHLQNMEKARELWNTMMSCGYNKYAQMWLDFYNLERAFGDVEHERKTLQMGVQCASDFPETIVEVFLAFEKDVGTLEQYEAALTRCESQMKRVKERRTKAAEKEIEQKKNFVEERKSFKTEKGPKNFANVKERKENFKQQEKSAVSQPGPSGNVRKRPPPPGFDRQKLAEHSQKKSKLDKPEENTQVPQIQYDDLRTVFLSNLAYSVEEEAIKEVFKPVGIVTDLRIVKDFRGNSKGYGYLEFENKSMAEEALKMDRHLLDGRPMYISQCNTDKSKPVQKKFKYETNLEKKKLFIKGLSFETTKEDLEKFFGEFGEVKEVRLVTFRSGKPKGLAFVDFMNESEASTAVLKSDGTTLQGKQINVALSNPPERKDKSEPESFTPTLGSTSVQSYGSRGRGRSNLGMLPRSLTASRNIPKTENGSSNGTNAPKLSNSDFRAMLLKK